MKPQKLNRPFVLIHRMLAWTFAGWLLSIGQLSAGTSADVDSQGNPDAERRSPSQVIASGNQRIIGYYPGWGIYARNYQVTDIPAARLTHINYAFAIIENGECALSDPWAETQKLYDGEATGTFGQLRKLKLQYPHLKILISVGGWNGSDKFSQVAWENSSRQQFAQSCVAFMVDHGFDGIDIDWEFPVTGGRDPSVGQPEDMQNYTLLLAEIRFRLDNQQSIDGRSYLLTIASPASEQHYQYIELENIHVYLDFINLLTYDFHGSLDSETNFNAPLFPTAGDTSELNDDNAVQAYLSAGVPPEKLVLWIPFYGRGWQGVPNINNGLYQPGSITTSLPTTWIIRSTN